MQNDIEELYRLNRQIGAAESTGDGAWLEGVLAPQLAFRRASGTIASRTDFFAFGCAG